MVLKLGSIIDITNQKYLEVIVVDAKLSGSSGWTRNQIVAKGMNNWLVKTNPNVTSLVKGNDIVNFRKGKSVTKKGDFIKLYEESGVLKTN